MVSRLKMIKRLSEFEDLVKENESLDTFSDEGYNWYFSGGLDKVRGKIELLEEFLTSGKNGKR